MIPEILVLILIKNNQHQNLNEKKKSVVKVVKKTQLKNLSLLLSQSKGRNQNDESWKLMSIWIQMFVHLDLSINPNLALCTI